MNSEMQSRLFEIVDHERNAGCTMADESLVPIAIRRWNSFNRRHQKSKNLTLEHRANDLLKIFLSQFPDFNYDESCLKHLAQSFALVLCTSTDNRDPNIEKLVTKNLPNLWILHVRYAWARRALDWEKWRRWHTGCGLQ